MMLALPGAQAAAQDSLEQSMTREFGDEPRASEQSEDQTTPTVQRETGAYPSASSTSGSFTVGSIIIAGNETLPDSEFLDLIEEYTSQPLSQQDLATLATRIAVRAQAKGFIFATASVPEQRLDLGVLRVELDEGRIDEVRLEGAQDAAIARQLAPLASGGPVTKDRLEHQLLLADDISGVRILGSRFEKEGTRGVLIVKARRSKASGYAEVTNNGSKTVGPIRARISVDFNGLLSSADEVDVTVGTTPLQPSELQFARASYKIVVDASGLELGTHLSYSSTAPGDFLSDREIEGEFWRAGVSARYPLKRSRDLSVWVVGEFEVTDLKSERFGDLVRHDRVPKVSAGLYSRGRLAGGWFRGQVMASRGLDILSATDPGDPLASRSDASARFSSLYGWFAWEGSLARSFSLALGARAQLAADPVLVTEDIGIGGTSFLRGYDFNERTGDTGIMGYGELRYNWRGEGFWLPRAQAYVFADGGTVTNLEDGFGSGSLASAGGGLRLNVTRDLNLGVEMAVPLTGERADSDSDSPLFNLRVGQSF
ncbi:ShlB/FhaC/HecB family hemolysin secretion/activation protein [Erythrobacter sp. SCSIO 43205]|uniref:ShlB/FhaC/HecB family hemolysin secretion/activation protein n=1 Tax=Erythrobacter sp. SCSIO 43205 TaxID=2779361 RepID=UPI001CA813AE|nr:ShlB/FhaC/HecB family hemolysin secretion/activation protein [Erythrobacter sp. SCSIO 43205]UAB79557.1 ShlB/FhaC/HecB family hemolysin secretion/activation protein [Erythrobacter sp. SCSIO 43205]